MVSKSDIPENLFLIMIYKHGYINFKVDQSSTLSSGAQKIISSKEI